MILKFCVASGAVPLVAVTVPMKTPVVVGVPLITPAALNVNPGGRLPAVTLNVAATERNVANERLEADAMWNITSPCASG